MAHKRFAVFMIVALAGCANPGGEADGGTGGGSGSSGGGAGATGGGSAATGGGSGVTGGGSGSTGGGAATTGGGDGVTGGGTTATGGGAGVTGGGTGATGGGAGATGGGAASGPRGLSTSSALTSTLSIYHQPPPCPTGCMPVNETVTYPNGNSLNQRPSFIETDTEVKVSVLRHVMHSLNGSTWETDDLVMVAFPKDATGTVSCSGASRDATLLIDTAAGNAIASGSAPCEFSIDTNTPSQIVVSFDHLQLLGVTQEIHMIDGTLTIPLQPRAPGVRSLGNVANLTVNGSFGSGSASFVTNPSLVEADGGLTYQGEATDSNGIVYTLHFEMVSSGLGLVPMSLPNTTPGGASGWISALGTYYDAAGTLRVVENTSTRLVIEAPSLLTVERASQNYGPNASFGFDLPLVSN